MDNRPQILTRIWSSVIGSGRGALLRQFLRETPDVQLVDTLQYLP
jgi:hypothetical protein